MSSTSAPPRPDSHNRVLDIAWDMASAQGLDNLSLASVARQAGVSRQAIYLFFGSRAGLLLAMTRRKDETSGIFDRIREARTDPDPETAVRRTVAVWFDYLPDIHPVARALAGALDADAEQAWQTRMRSLRAIFLGLAKRLAEAGQLGRGWTAETAADMLYAQSHYFVWRLLVIDLGWTTRDAAGLQARTALQAIAQPHS